MRLLCSACLIAAATSAIVSGQPAATIAVEQMLTQRLGSTQNDLIKFKAGQAVVFPVTATADNEVAAVGAIRAKGDLRRILAWLRDIESFMRASGTENVGAIASPATAADFARLNINDLDFSALKTCKSDDCEIRMPPAFLKRFQTEVAWSTPNAQSQAATLTRALVAEYVAAYQKGGDTALGAFHNPAKPQTQHAEFQDMLRRSTKAWEFSHSFASYLESYPASAPPGTESRFYWTRDTVNRKPTLTLHHVVLQELPGGRLLAADKQFYASRTFDAGLMTAFGVPDAGFTTFDLVVAVKVRASAISGVAGRLMRGRIDKEVRDGLTTYLEWIKNSAAL